MFKRSVSPTITRSFANDILAAIATGAPLAELLDSAEIVLLKTNFASHPDLEDLTTLEECDFGGYAGVVPAAWIGPVNAGFNGQAMHAEGNFAADNTIAGAQGAVGYAVHVANAVKVIELFAEPASFTMENDALSLDVVLQLPFEWPVTL